MKEKSIRMIIIFFSAVPLPPNPISDLIFSRIQINADICLGTSHFFMLNKGLTLKVACLPKPFLS